MSDACGIWSEAVSVEQDEVIGELWGSCSKTRSNLGRDEGGDGRERDREETITYPFSVMSPS